MFTNQSINQSIRLSQSINQSINQSISQSINQSVSLLNVIDNRSDGTDQLSLLPLAGREMSSSYGYGVKA